MNKNNIKEIIDQFLSEIYFCKKYNQPYSTITQSLSERITVELFNLELAAKKSYSFDTNLDDELKSCEYLQPKICKKCEKITNYLNEICSCGSEDFKINSGDSRWSIDSVSHFAYFERLNRYILYLISCNDTKKLNFSIKGWIIDKHNEHFNYILKNQSKAISKGLNFLPYNHDFFLSDPLLFLDMDFDKDNISYNFLNMEEPKIYLLEKNHFNYNSQILNANDIKYILDLNGISYYSKKNKSELLDLLFEKNDSIKISDFKLEKRKKPLDKNRGETKR